MSKILFQPFWIIFFILFCMLGNWQLSKYHQKKHLLQAVSRNLYAAPQNFTGKFEPFLHVKIRGRYLDHDTVLLQNRLNHGKSGADVLTPFQPTGDNRVILVNRGWTSNLKIPETQSGHEIRGYLTPVLGYQFILGKNILYPDQKPLKIQRMDMSEISRMLGKDFYPFILRLAAAEPNGFLREFSFESVTAVSPERHLGYAIQWYLMAVVLLVACVVYYRKDRKMGKNK